ncbi:hypothetical protein Q5P01_008769 [Channa striata]|uniref:Uncharacterized protein n=1 Tax=Channa striata TaxID=64152 RepID=A0AA88N1A8_CHASR|nr:hypothetical protein Q5P01_008769 [Channa striata]
MVMTLRYRLNRQKFYKLPPTTSGGAACYVLAVVVVLTVKRHLPAAVRLCRRGDSQLPPPPSRPPGAWSHPPQLQQTSVCDRTRNSERTRRSQSPRVRTLVSGRRLCCELTKGWNFGAGGGGSSALDGASRAAGAT